MNDKSKTSHQENLETIFDFTDDDLEVNRAGNINPRQLKNLRAEVGKLIGRHKPDLILTFFVTAVFSLLLFIAAQLLAVSYDSTIEFGVKFLICISAFAFCAFLLTLLSLARQHRRLWQDHQQGRVESADGYVALNIQRENNSLELHPTPYIVWIGEEKFSVEEKQFLTFKNGDPYRVYFAAHSRTILSVEWLNANPFE